MLGVIINGVRFYFKKRENYKYSGEIDFEYEVIMILIIFIGGWVCKLMY